MIPLGFAPAELNFFDRVHRKLKNKTSDQQSAIIKKEFQHRLAQLKYFTHFHKIACEFDKFYDQASIIEDPQQRSVFLDEQFAKRPSEQQDYDQYVDRNHRSFTGFFSDVIEGLGSLGKRPNKSARHASSPQLGGLGSSSAAAAAPSSAPLASELSPLASLPESDQDAEGMAGPEQDNQVISARTSGASATSSGSASMPSPVIDPDGHVGPTGDSEDEELTSAEEMVIVFDSGTVQRLEQNAEANDEDSVPALPNFKILARRSSARGAPSPSLSTEPRALYTPAFAELHIPVSQLLSSLPRTLSDHKNPPSPPNYPRLEIRPPSAPPPRCFASTPAISTPHSTRSVSSNSSGDHEARAASDTPPSVGPTRLV
jgi:hypothetical protein